MHRFLTDKAPIVGKHIPLSAEESKHALRVLRLREGDRVELSDGRGALFAGRISKIEGDIAVCTAEAALDSREPPVRVTLFIGLSKFDKTEFVAQKATELGAERIVPVIMRRSVARYDKKDAEKKRERMEKICREAAKQCGRARVPDVFAALPLAEALPLLRGVQLLLMPWEEAEDNRLSDVYKAHPNASDIGILIGPEGGIDPSEAALCPAVQVTLGRRILRAETAAIASISMVMQLWGDM
ncbi:MAG: RsmE family RNA methyltransferase [Christensenellales bacterium]|jgi:16S rRNA (uracil1498-N3)-methyltransferase